MQGATDFRKLFLLPLGFFLHSRNSLGFLRLETIYSNLCTRVGVSHRGPDGLLGAGTHTRLLINSDEFLMDSGVMKKLTFLLVIGDKLLGRGLEPGIWSWPVGQALPHQKV